MIPRYEAACKDGGDLAADENRFRIWLDIEAGYACDAQAALGVIPESAALAVRERGAFEIARIDEIERETRHDVIAFLTNVTEHARARGAVRAPGHDARATCSIPASRCN